jgi:hypothetical protein
MGKKSKDKTPTTDEGDDTDNRPVPKSPLTELWDRRGTRDADYERKKQEKDLENE